jgi:flagellar protein FlgJ
VVAPTNASSQLAIDAQSLDQLRAQAKRSPDEALKATAQQFESVFINMMLKSMREATPQDGMLDSEQTKMYTSMLDQQLSQSMASRGIGLADIMVKQLSKQHNSTPEPVAADGSIMPKS